MLGAVGVAKIGERRKLVIQRTREEEVRRKLGIKIFKKDFELVIEVSMKTVNERIFGERVL